MNKASLNYLLRSGKNAKLPYFVNAFARLAVPKRWLRSRLPHILAEINSRPDADEIYRRADYYNKLGEVNVSNRLTTEERSAIPLISDLRPESQKVYFLDTMEYARYFPSNLRLELKAGDNTIVPAIPSIVKSRPIGPDNNNAVLLNLDKVRHFIFLSDKYKFADKDDKALFRGKACGKSNRLAFIEKYWGNPRFHLATIDAPRPEWQGQKLSLYDQLRHRYIMTLEGNDVASNLKWVMSSNSIAVTPRMKYETWFMEGLLKGGEHYIEVADDFSDVEDRLDYYSSHPAEARDILDNAHSYVARFRNPHREKLISLLVLYRYLQAVNPGYSL